MFGVSGPSVPQGEPEKGVGVNSTAARPYWLASSPVSPAGTRGQEMEWAGLVPQQAGGLSLGSAPSSYVVQKAGCPQVGSVGVTKETCPRGWLLHSIPLFTLAMVHLPPSPRAPWGAAAGGARRSGRSHLSGPPGHLREGGSRRARGCKHRQRGLCRSCLVPHVAQLRWLPQGPRPGAGGLQWCSFPPTGG